MSATRGRVCARVLAHALVLTCIAFVVAAAQAPAAAPPAGFYGVNSGGTLVNDVAARPAALTMMRAIGLSHVRVDASWGGVEPNAPVAGVHTYVWAKYDLFVADLARHGLRWYPMLGYSAPWASSAAGEPFAPPTGDADYAAFAAAFAQRYGTGGSFWAEHPELPALPTTVYGIWNEPSNPHFWHGPDATPARYMNLYLAARATIRSVDPAARVATAGLLDSGVVDANAFLRAMLDSAPGARNQIDVIGWHPYVGSVDQVITSIARARTTLTRYGLTRVPIEISEIGWHTGYDTAQRATWMRTLAATLPHADLNVTRLMPYVWSGDPIWQLTDPDGSLGPVGSAYQAGIRDAYQPHATMPAAVAPQPVSAPNTTKPAKAAKKAKAAKACKTAKTTTGKKATSVRKCTASRKRSRASKKAKAAKARSRRAKAAKARVARA